MYHFLKSGLMHSAATSPSATLVGIADIRITATSRRRVSQSDFLDIDWSWHQCFCGHVGDAHGA